MAREFKLPDIGEGVYEGEVVKWFVKEGDSVKENDPVVEVLTDKVTVQIPSPVTGKILQIRAKEGEVVNVGSVLVVFGEAGETVPPAPPRRCRSPRRPLLRPRPSERSSRPPRSDDSRRSSAWTSRGSAVAARAGESSRTTSARRRRLLCR